MKTDKQLQLDVIAELGWEPSLDAGRIGVAVADGIVTLTGHVDSYSEKLSAERATRRVSGVQGLAVEIVVQLPGFSKRPDADIARSARNALLWASYLPKDAVHAQVENGWITLTGTVEWDYQRRSASAVVRHLLGVIGVSDEMVVRPRLSLSAVRGDIEAVLKRRAIDDAGNISVSIEGTDITLSGTVHSWSERELARHSAWSTPGVHNVVDRLTIVA